MYINCIAPSNQFLLGFLSEQCVLLNPCIIASCNYYVLWFLGIDFMKAFALILEHFNIYLFQCINAPATISNGMLLSGIFFSSYAVVLFPLTLLFNWVFYGAAHKKAVCYALFSMNIAVLINTIIGFLWQHPRPFMIPLGHNFIFHAANNSFPSNHASLAFSISFSLAGHYILRYQGIFLIAVSILVAWGRIYMGVHFPLDVVASMGIALGSTLLSFYCPRLVGAMYMHIHNCYQMLFPRKVRNDITK